MERFLTKESAVMSKDFFMRQRPSGQKSSHHPQPPPHASRATTTSTTTTTTTTPSCSRSDEKEEDDSSPPDRSAGGGSGRRGRGGLLAQAQLMSRNHFRRGPSPPPSLRRAETWTGPLPPSPISSRDNLSTRSADAGDTSGLSGEGTGLWTECPGLLILKKRREEEAMLEEKLQEAMGLWQDMEREGLEPLIFDVPSEDEENESTEQQSGSNHPQLSGDKRMSNTCKSEAQQTEPAVVPANMHTRSKRILSNTNEEQDLSSDNGASEREAGSSSGTMPRESPAENLPDGNRNRSGRPNPIAAEKAKQQDQKNKRASVLGVLQVDKLFAGGNEEPESGEESTETESSKERSVKKTAYGRLYSTLRRRKQLSRGPTDSENDESEKGGHKAEKKREKQKKAERRKRQKTQKAKHAKKGPLATGDNALGEISDAETDKRPRHNKGAAGVLERRGTIPRNFKMHFMDVFKSAEGDIEHTKGKRDKKKKRMRRHKLVARYSEPEMDLPSRDRIVNETQESNSDGGELKKKLKKARKKNKQQEEQIKAQQLEIEHMRTELERVRRQRTERKRKEKAGTASSDGGDHRPGPPDDDHNSSSVNNGKPKKTKQA